MKNTNHPKKQQNKRPNYINKLTKTEFYDVYGISLFYGIVKLSDNYILSLLLPIAQKYYDITYHALTAELRYFLRGEAKGFSLNTNSKWDIDENFDRLFYSKHNIKLLKKLKIKNWKKERKLLSLDKIYQLFHSGEWTENCFGGEAWANITLACKNLKNAIDRKDISDICIRIDYLNDLEHNSNRYLGCYCTFSLNEELSHKFNAPEEEILNYCSPQVKELQKF
jgi:hypothetical protein